MRIINNEMVRMRDGTGLATDIYFPDNMDKGPVLVARTPYSKRGLEEEARFWTANDYILVAQDVRGRYDSQGEFIGHLSEAEDGADMMKWLIDQDWCDGNIGTIGGSYLGGTQWLAAGSNPKCLKAMIPEVTFDDAYEGMTYQGGAKILHDLRWMAANIIPDAVARAEREGGVKEERPLPEVDYILEKLPLAGDPMIEEYGSFYIDWLRHDGNGPFWEPMSPYKGYPQIHVPVLNISGWYDIFVSSTLRNYMGMKAHGPKEVRDRQYLIMGPWSHMSYEGVFPEMNYGSMANALKMGLKEIKLAWFDYFLKGLDVELMSHKVKLFVMGINQWKGFDDWPLAQACEESFYLHSKGNANSLYGGGFLDREEPGQEETDSFIYNPFDPVPTLGGQVLLPGENAIGPRDQTQVEKRQDVLVYTSEVLENAMEVIGPVKLILYGSSKAVDTDFTGKLVDVYPDGRAILITDGIIRGRYRDSDRHPQPLVPDQVYPFEIDMGATANVFLPGHRIRLEISSSNFPKFNRNSNTGGTIYLEEAHEYMSVSNKVWHSDRYPSRLILPLVK